MQVISATIMLEWKERENEIDDVAIFQIPWSIVALRNFGLLKYVKMKKMKKEVLLLEHMIGLWNVAEQGFQMGTWILIIELEYVYFITGLSKRGAPIVLVRQQVLLAPVDEYLANHCVPGLRLVDDRIAIKDIRDLSLWSIMFSITSIVGSMSAHLVSRSQVAYGL